MEGSIIPFYYPDNKKLNTSDFDSCNQECANAGAKYFSFSTVAHVGTTLVSKSPSTTTSTSTKGSTGQITSDIVPGTTEKGGLVQCGRPGQHMCTLCDLIKGMNIIVKYLMKIAIGVALLAMAIGGVMYVVSAGDTKLIEQGKNTMINAGIGFVIIFAGWLIINTTISYLGTKQGMGIDTSVTSWGDFNCNANLGGK